MSKSLGTGVDPLEVIAEYGADATRYGLLKLSSSQDVRFSTEAIVEGRRLANKLWNVSRLLLQAGGEEVEPRPATVEERWVLARIDATRAELESRLAAFDFAPAVQALYHLTFDEFCDWYAEAVKPRLYERDTDAVATALAALERLLALVHPFMPHLSEEIWSQLPGRTTRLIVARWPEPQGEYAADAHALDRVRAAATVFRRAGVAPTGLDHDERRIFDAVVRPGRTPAGADAEAERARLRAEVARAEAMLANVRFRERAPAAVVTAERDKLARYRRELAAIGG
jgi:valyl-tRNA synthetase